LFALGFKQAGDELSFRGSLCLGSWLVGSFSQPFDTVAYKCPQESAFRHVVHFLLIVVIRTKVILVISIELPAMRETIHHWHHVCSVSCRGIHISGDERYGRLY
jgi:hypothetical protein